MANTKIFDLLDQIPQCFEEPFIGTSNELDAIVSRYGLKNLHTNYRIQSPIADFEALWYRDTCIASLSGLASNRLRELQEFARQQILVGSAFYSLPIGLKFNCLN